MREVHTLDTAQVGNKVVKARDLTIGSLIVSNNMVWRVHRIDLHSDPVGVMSIYTRDQHSHAVWGRIDERTEFNTVYAVEAAPSGGAV